MYISQAVLDEIDVTVTSVFPSGIAAADDAVGDTGATYLVVRFSLPFRQYSDSVGEIVSSEARADVDRLGEEGAVAQNAEEIRLATEELVAVARSAVIKLHAAGGKSGVLYSLIRERRDGAALTEDAAPKFLEEPIAR